MRKLRLTNIFEVTQLIPGAATICSPRSIRLQSKFSLGFYCKSYWSEVHFPFWSDFFLVWVLYCLDHLEEFPNRTTVLGESERKMVSCPSLCEGVQAQHPA